MIVSANPIPHRNEFKLLMDATLNVINQRAKKSTSEISKLAGNKLEPFIKEIMTEQAIGSVFENTIELISGQKFPDIVAKKYYGIEVKSTTQNHWKTTGNSVLESTRVEDVERIFMLFGKLGKPIEFRYRPYEECLSEVVVTHSPRYLIDMNLPFGSAIFDKMGIEYDALRKQKNPIKSVVDYYKSKLKPGEDVWWMGQDEISKSSNIIIKIWNNLSANEKIELKLKAMVFFPEVVSNRNDKFGRLAIWLVTQEGVVCPNVRDLFTAGGKSNLLIGRKTYRNVPRMILTLIQNLPRITETIFKTPALQLSDYWKIRTTEKTKLDTWIQLIVKEAGSISKAYDLDILEIITKALLKQ